MRRDLFLLPITLLLAQGPPPGWKEFSIGPPTRNGASFNPRQGLRAEGIPFRRAIARAWGIDENFVDGPPWISNQRYAITALISGEPGTFQPLFQKELAKRFHLQAHLEKRDAAVYVLQTIDDTPHRMKETSGMQGSRETTAGRVTVVNGTLADLGQSLTTLLARPVLDETGIAGRKFDIQVTWDQTDPSTAAAAIKEQLGLQLTDAKRPVEFLVIDRVEPLN